MRAPRFQNQQAQEKKPSIEDMLVLQENQNAIAQLQSATIENLEGQIRYCKYYN